MIRQGQFVAMGFMGSFAGCLAERPVLTERFAPIGQPRAATSPSEVRFPRAEELPEGITYDRSGGTFDPTFPSTEDPHRLLGRVTFPLDRDRDRLDPFGAEKRKNLSVQYATKIGANAVYFWQNASGGVSADLIYFSPLKATQPTEEEAAASMASYVKTWQNAEATRIALDSPASLRIKRNAHSCAALVIALDSDAVADKESWKFGWVASTGPHQHEKYVATVKKRRGAFVPIGCVANATTNEVTLASHTERPLGTGHASIQVYRYQPKPSIWQNACTRCSGPQNTYDKSCLAQDNLTADICR